MRRGYRHCLLVVFVSLLSTASVLADVVNDGVRVASVADLARDGKTAKRRGVAILLEFAADDCPYCIMLEEEFLKPMLRSGEYDEKILMRVVDISQELPLTDFQSNRSSTTALAQRFDVNLTPTVLLVDSHGRLLTAPLVGIWSLDYFGGILDDRIDAALSKVKRAHEFRVQSNR